MRCLRFQSTLPRRERHAHGCDACCAVIISIHAPAKGATRELRDADEWEVLFQSTLPRRERPVDLFDTRLRDVLFQSTLPRRERLKSAQCVSAIAAFQSTLPQRERPCQTARCHAQSAHFNPRSREGSDINPPKITAAQTYFNPRSREGSDPPVAWLVQPADLISIHAPAKGATSATWRVSVGVTFQSTLPRRERHIHHFSPPSTISFQSTLPRRERRRACWLHSPAP